MMRVLFIALTAAVLLAILEALRWNRVTRFDISNTVKTIAQWRKRVSVGVSIYAIGVAIVISIHVFGSKISFSTLQQHGAFSGGIFDSAIWLGSFMTIRNILFLWFGWHAVEADQIIKDRGSQNKGH